MESLYNHHVCFLYFFHQANLQRITAMTHPIYNKKAFLLPDSINSMACYHAKIDEKGIYKLTIHDCNTSIRLWGDLNTEEGRKEALEKLETLINGAVELQDFIFQNYK